jgi:hypothetical protein
LYKSEVLAAQLPQWKGEGMVKSYPECKECGEKKHLKKATPEGCLRVDKGVLI